MPFLIVDPVNVHGRRAPLPYDDSELQQAEEWLDSLPPAINQRDLVNAWQALPGATSNEQIIADSMWLDGGPKRNVKELRQSSPGIGVVLASDSPEILAGRMKLAEAVVPMNMPPRGFDWRDWDDCRGVPVAPDGAIDYDQLRGGRWLKEQN